MAQGDYISRSNMPVPQYDDGNFDNWYDYDRPTATFYVSAPVFVAWIRVSAVLFRNPEMWLDVYKWDGGSGFTLVNSGYVSATNSGSDNWYFRHNCSGSGGVNETGGVHLFKLVVRSDVNGSATGTFSVGVGSVRSNANVNSSTYASGTLIRACKPALYQSGGTYTSDAGFISGEGPSARRGVIIDTSNANFCYGEY